MAKQIQQKQGFGQDMIKPNTSKFKNLCRSLDKRPRMYRFIKRTFDVVFSSIVLLIGFIPCVILSIAIMLDTKGTPLYSQVRVGRDGEPFRIFKFRTMVADSDNVRKYLNDEQFDQWRRERKVDGDPRITRLGRVLRATSIDEIPNFINVLLGQISVIGPRAITYDELEQFGDEKALLLSVRPGITGLWQVGERNEATFESGRRQELELEYVKKADIAVDARIFLRTFTTMAEKTGK